MKVSDDNDDDVVGDGQTVIVVADVVSQTPLDPLCPFGRQQNFKKILGHERASRLD